MLSVGIDLILFIRDEDSTANASIGASVSGDLVVDDNDLSNRVLVAVSHVELELDVRLSFVVRSVAGSVGSDVRGSVEPRVAGIVRNWATSMSTARDVVMASLRSAVGARMDVDAASNALLETLDVHFQGAGETVETDLDLALNVGVSRIRATVRRSHHGLEALLVSAVTGELAGLVGAEVLLRRRDDEDIMITLANEASQTKANAPPLRDTALPRRGRTRWMR